MIKETKLEQRENEGGQRERQRETEHAHTHQPCRLGGKEFVKLHTNLHNICLLCVLNACYSAFIFVLHFLFIIWSYFFLFRKQLDFIHREFFFSVENYAITWNKYHKNEANVEEAEEIFEKQNKHKHAFKHLEMELMLLAYNEQNMEFYDDDGDDDDDDE